MTPDPDVEDLRRHAGRVAIKVTGRVLRDDGESVYRSLRDVLLDRAGHVTEDSWEDDSGAVSRKVLTYDSRGRLKETVEAGTNQDGGGWEFRRRYGYDDRGRLAEELCLLADGAIVGRRRPTYAADGRRMEEEQFEPCRCGARDGMPTIGVSGCNMSFACRPARSGRVVYDGCGIPLEITFTGRMGLTVGKVLFESVAGRISAIRAYGDTGSFDSVSTKLRAIAPVVLWVDRRIHNGWVRWNLFRHGEWPTLARTLLWGPLGFEILTRYDANGHPIEERHRAMGGAYETIKTWEYDADGRVVELRDVDHTGELTDRKVYTYDVDSHGKWVHRTVAGQRLPDSLEVVNETVERVIQYYE